MSPWTAARESPGSPEAAPSAAYIRELPILVIFPHSRCNCRCMMCDIWKIRQIREITAADLEPHVASLRKLKVKWIVFSGGEPLMHSDLASLARMCRAEGMRVTILTAGLLLERNAAMLAASVDDVIVSIDGPLAIHDLIRGVPGAFRRLQRGIQALRIWGIPIHGRCTIQKHNFRHLRATLRTAHDLELTTLSFLAADVSSEAFNRPGGWDQERTAEIALGEHDLRDLEEEIEALIREGGQDLESGFVVESPEKLRRIALRFAAHLGQAPPMAPRCNAPWVSAVLEADGTVRPCFFHRPMGNLRNGSLDDILNSAPAQEFRRHLDVPNDPICQRCVCSLFLENQHSLTPNGVK